MSYLGLFAWSFAVALGPVMSPGPVSTAVVTQGIRRGFRAGPLISTGHALMELLLVGALALGVGQLLESPVWAAAIGVLGGIFLLWMGGTMGWTAVRRAPKLPRADGGAATGPGGGLVALGVATTLGNPFWYIWWIIVGGGYVLVTMQQGLSSLLAFYLGHISADYVWNSVLATVVASGRSWLTDRIYQALLLVCGLFLVYTGLRFIWAGVGMVAG